jgi:hypothetical protein
MPKADAAKMNVRLITNPTADNAFRLAAEASLAAGAASPVGLEARLREEYPRVSVVCGIAEVGSERWYAYRDGHWIDSALRRDEQKTG